MAVFKSGEDHKHHVLPLGRGTDTFANAWAEAGIDPEKFKVNMDKFFHGKMHGRGGGKWNKSWKLFLELNKDKQLKPERIMGFAFSMLQNIGMDLVPFL